MISEPVQSILLAKAWGLSIRTGAQTMFYLLLTNYFITIIIGRVKNVPSSFDIIRSKLSEQLIGIQCYTSTAIQEKQSTYSTLCLMSCQDV